MGSPDPADASDAAPECASVKLRPRNATAEAGADLGGQYLGAADLQERARRRAGDRAAHRRVLNIRYVSEPLRRSLG